MDNAERIYNELRHEQAAIWYISDKYGAKIMIKVPSTSIKALLKGCKIEFLFGRDDNQIPSVIHVGVRIYDDPINYQVITCVQRFLYEHLSIAKIMHLVTVQVQFYNELNVCQAYGMLKFDEWDRHNIHSFLGNPKRLFIGDFSSTISESLDNFQYSLGLEYNFPNPSRVIKVLIVETVLSKLEIVKNTFFNQKGRMNLSIDNSDEGNVLENEVFLTLSSLFDNDVFKGPIIRHKNTFRELTDILAFSQYGIFLIEAKALGVINVVGERTMDRKVTGLQKQMIKAIKQLVGATRKVTEGVSIYDSNGREVMFDKTLLPHGIILISEMLPFDEYKETVKALLNAMVVCKIYIHIMDMKEYMKYITYSNGDKNKFDYYLVKRIESFVKNPTLTSRTEFVEG